MIVLYGDYFILFFFSRYYVHRSLFFFFLMIRPPPSSPLFPYRTLFRSLPLLPLARAARADEAPFPLPFPLSPEPGPCPPPSFEPLPPPEPVLALADGLDPWPRWDAPDRKSTRLNSSHYLISYAAFCLKK